VYDNAERGLLAAKRWFDQNRLTVNLNKTKHMPISLRADFDPPDLQLRLHTCGGVNGCVTCECVQRVTEYRYLGVFFDHRLNWSGHVQYLRSKLRKYVFIFSNLSKILPPPLLRNVYFAYVQSVIQ
jgi:hypothetical protein